MIAGEAERFVDGLERIELVGEELEEDEYAVGVGDELQEVGEL